MSKLNDTTIASGLLHLTHQQWFDLLAAAQDTLNQQLDWHREEKERPVIDVVEEEHCLQVVNKSRALVAHLRGLNLANGKGGYVKLGELFDSEQARQFAEAFGVLLPVPA